MKTYLDCIPCFFKQALEAARLAGASPKTQKKVLNRLGRALSRVSLDASPPEIGRIIYGLVRKVTGKKDPYRKIKKKSNKLALRLYGKLKNKVRRSKKNLLTAVELAIAGNIIDYGVKNSLDVNKELKKILEEEQRVIKNESERFFNFAEFTRALKNSRTILYLGDNAGETVFDRILIEEINRRYGDKRIFYAVKEKPIINDALFEDAKACGIDRIARVISSGLDVPGTVLHLCSEEFLKIYRSADMVISKGQGNFEALSDSGKKIFYLFMAKCPVVARDIKCDTGDIILLYNGKRNA